MGFLNKFVPRIRAKTTLQNWSSDLADPREQTTAITSFFAELRDRKNRFHPDGSKTRAVRLGRYKLSRFRFRPVDVSNSVR